jgi:hypothetical protein
VLALGYYRRGRGFADRVFADRSFADGPLTNWRGLDNRLRAREVRSDRRSRQSQRRSTNDYEFQHEVPLLRLKTTRIVDLYDHYGAINRCLSKRAIFFTNVAETARLNKPNDHRVAFEVDDTRALSLSGRALESDAAPVG